MSLFSPLTNFLLETVICLLNKCFVALKVCKYIFLHLFNYLNSDTTRHKFCIRKKMNYLKRVFKICKENKQKKEYIKLSA